MKKSVLYQANTGVNSCGKEVSVFLEGIVLMKCKVKNVE